MSVMKAARRRWECHSYSLLLMTSNRRYCHPNRSSTHMPGYVCMPADARMHTTWLCSQQRAPLGRTTPRRCRSGCDDLRQGAHWGLRYICCVSLCCGRHHPAHGALNVECRLVCAATPNAFDDLTHINALLLGQQFLWSKHKSRPLSAGMGAVMCSKLICYIAIYIRQLQQAEDVLLHKLPYMCGHIW